MDFFQCFYFFGPNEKKKLKKIKNNIINVDLLIPKVLTLTFGGIFKISFKILC
ncbi:hypothetical protein L282_1179 [Escherichia coli APEC IMT5155]|nr:hypothetical protein L282_1179 [Escherichia coli APEC IMT5155]